MPANFYTRLREYYQKVAEVLRGEADAASIFPNTTDKGIVRENVYAEFLRQHAPAKCNVFLGGFLFDFAGNESKQLDVIVTTDTAPRFDLHNPGGAGKSFSPVEGTLGVASIKSVLNKDHLYDALDGIASIPPTSIASRVVPPVVIKNYDDWPYKVVYAYDGLTAGTIKLHMEEYYAARPHIPRTRTPNIIHVAGKYLIARVAPWMVFTTAGTGEPRPVPIGSFQLLAQDPDIHGILWVLHELQQNASASTHILFNCKDVINAVLTSPR